MQIPQISFLGMNLFHAAAAASGDAHNERGQAFTTLDMVVRLLPVKGRLDSVRVFAQDWRGSTALHIAAAHGAPGEILDRLLARADTEHRSAAHPVEAIPVEGCAALAGVRDGAGRTALLVALTRPGLVSSDATGFLSGVLRLLNFPSTFMMGDKCGNAPMHVACARGLTAVVERMLVADPANTYLLLNPAAVLDLTTLGSGLGSADGGEAPPPPSPTATIRRASDASSSIVSTCVRHARRGPHWKWRCARGTLVSCALS